LVSICSLFIMLRVEEMQAGVSVWSDENNRIMQSGISWKIARCE